VPQSRPRVGSRLGSRVIRDDLGLIVSAFECPAVLEFGSRSLTIAKFSALAASPELDYLQLDAWLRELERFNSEQTANHQVRVVNVGHDSRSLSVTVWFSLLPYAVEAAKLLERHLLERVLARGLADDVEVGAERPWQLVLRRDLPERPSGASSGVFLSGAFGDYRRTPRAWADSFRLALSEGRGELRSILRRTPLNQRSRDSLEWLAFDPPMPPPEQLVLARNGIGIELLVRYPWPTNRAAFDERCEESRQRSAWSCYSDWSRRALEFSLLLPELPSPERN